MIKSKKRLLFLILFVFVLVAAAIINTRTFGKLEVKSVVLVPKRLALVEKESTDIEFKFIPEISDTSDIQIVSSDEIVIDITGNTVYAVGHGEAYVFARDKTGKKLSNTVKFTVERLPLTNDDFVYVGKTGKKYHYEECSTIQKYKTAIKLSDAIAQGRTPCSRCSPK